MSCEITWQNNISIAKVSRMLTFLDGLIPIMSYDTLFTWFCDITWDTLITWFCEITWYIITMISSLPQYLYHQTWQDGDLPWGAPFCKVTWPNDHMDFQGHVINKSQYVSLTSILITTKLGRVVTYLEGFLPIKSRGLTRSHDRLKPLYLHYHNAYAH